MLTLTRQLLAAACLTAAACVACCHTTAAQETARQTTHATLIGFGTARQLDTYLSPLNYRGPQLHLMHETLRTTPWAHRRITMQSIWHADFAYSHNTSERHHYLGGDVSYDIGWHYHFLGAPTADQASPSATLGSYYMRKEDDDTPQPATPQQHTSPFRLFAGPQLAANVGFLYNTHGGNNPAQALASLHLAASIGAVWHFRLWRQPIAARYQMDVPLIGIKFSPNYGQSYYEIFTLGNTDHNVCVTHPFNAFSSRHLLTLDIPFRRATLRVGYLCDIRQSHVNEIKYHSYGHAFMLGLVRHLSIHKSQRTIPPGYVL